MSLGIISQAGESMSRWWKDVGKYLHANQKVSPANSSVTSKFLNGIFKDTANPKSTYSLFGE